MNHLKKPIRPDDDLVAKVDAIVDGYAERVDVDLEDRDAWLGERGLGLGGSDAGAVLGVNPYQSAFQLALEKTGVTEPADLSNSEPVYWGHVLEAPIADRFSVEYDTPVWEPNAMFVSRKHPWMRATPDRFTVCPDCGEPTTLEVKSGNEFTKTNWEDDWFPPHYQAQCVHYVAVTGVVCSCEHVFLVVLLGGQSFQVRRVPITDSLLDAVIAAEKRFWEDYVIGGDLPVPDGAKSTTDALVDLWTAPEGLVELGNDEIVLASRYITLRDEIKALKEQRDEVGNQLRAAIGDGQEGVVDGTKIVTWKPQKRTGFQTKQFTADHPELAEQYQTVTDLRVLRIPKPAEEFIYTEAQNIVEAEG